MNFRDLLLPLYERHLLMQFSHIPTHIAIIQDGNRRFAKEMGIDTAKGHRAGADKTEEMLDWAHELGIRYITIYSFSTENFNRAEEEIRDLFLLFKEKFIRTITDERVHRYRIRIQMVGDRLLLPDDLRTAVEAAEEATKNYDGFTLNVALAYGGETRSSLPHGRSWLRSARARSPRRQSTCRWSNPTSMKEKVSRRSTSLSGPGTIPHLQLPAVARKRPRIRRLFLCPVLAALP